ncbi:MAG: hypothetical protein ACFWT2_11385 [Thermoanaerobacterium thermosaccharolyticum]
MSNKLYKAIISKNIYADVSAHMNMFGDYIGFTAEVVILMLLTSVWRSLVFLSDKYVRK